MNATNEYYALKESGADHNCLAVVKKGTTPKDTHRNFTRALRDHFDDAELVLPVISPDLTAILEDRASYGKSCTLFVTDRHGAEHEIEIEQVRLYGV